MIPAQRSAYAALTRWLLFILCMCVLSPGGCTCSPDVPLNPPRKLIACRARTPRHTPHTPPTPNPSAAPTAAAGTIPGSFSITSSGEATYVMPLITVPGRAGVEPQLSLTYDSAAGNGVLGAGFSLGGLSAITPCPSNLAGDGEIRGVRYDAADKLCLDNKRLIPVQQAPGSIEYRTLPDAQVKVIGHFPPGGEADQSALFFEAHMPSGLVVEYGNSDDGKPLALGGAPRAWLATKVHDGRGNGMTYAYCSSDADGYTAEYAIDEIRYTSFEGTPSLEPTRSVEFVYGTKDPADIGTPYAGGMALQSSLRLDEVQMLGPEDALVRRYRFTYGLGPTTHRTLLTQVEECAGDGVCKPPTRFQFKSSAAGFKNVETSVRVPIATRASPMLTDLDGDGLVDLLVPDADAMLSTPTNPITQWNVARNRGALASPPYFSSTALGFSEDWPMLAEPTGSSDPASLQPDLGTALDYDLDGRWDVLIHDVNNSRHDSQVLLAKPDHTFKVKDTGIARPFPLGVSPKPPSLSTTGGAIHLADLDGDGVPDLIQCEDHDALTSTDPNDLTGADPSDLTSADLSKPVWTVHLAKAALGFMPVGEIVESLAAFRCNTELYTLDVNGDGKVELLVETMLTSGGTEHVAAATYSALTRLHDGRWEVIDTKLPIVGPGGRVVFLDVNGDGLPDAVESGFEDHALRTYLNTGSSFVAVPGESLGSPGLGDQDTFFALALAIDFNSDGRQDLLMPMPPGTLPNESDALPAWAILEARGGLDGPTFTLVDPHLPFDAALGDAITLADPRGPRIGDLNGDGAEDVLLPLGGVFHVFENLAADQDLLVAVADGMNAHEPTEPAFVPNVSISYGHLTDASITNDEAADDPARESALYLAHADAANDCLYPRACAVGARRVVSAYATNNGADGLRRFSVRYRDGRYHRLGRGFLGFAERIVTDLDTGAGAADFYDNSTFVEGLNVFPFAGEVKHTWRWQPGLPSQPKPDELDVSFADVELTLVPTSDGASYFTLPTERRIRRMQGSYAQNGAEGPTLEAFVTKLATSGGAIVLLDTTIKVSDFDSFGNVRIEDTSTSGVDLTFHTERTFKNDTERWVLGQLQTEKACSTAAMLSACRTLSRTTTIYGEVDTDTTGSDDNSPDTALAVSYERDRYGNVTRITADDAYGHHRISSTHYDAEGIYPYQHVNAAGHVAFTEFDAGLGVLTKLTDPNRLVTRREYDGFGRLALETRPDGTETSVMLARTKDSGPNQDGWRVTARSTTTGGADDMVEVDSLGRPIRWWLHAPDTGVPGSDGRRVMQEIAYDALGEHVVLRSVPEREGTPEGQRYFDRYEYDALGREITHTMPWGAVVRTSYDALSAQITDALKNVTLVERDPLGRVVTITDAAQGVTSYTYGPFGALHTVIDPGGALTRMARDALGRVRQLDDPDRGTTISTHDGFGELISSLDALGRSITFGYDALGRATSRLDQHGLATSTTTWTWDTAPNGIGKLQAVTSPDGEKSYTYTALGQLETISLAIEGESDPLKGKLGYDDLGRVETITYPSLPGGTPFSVTQEHDPYGHVLAVRDGATNVPYWRLTEADSAGRFRKEVFGNNVTSERDYYPDKQRLAAIVTQNGIFSIQNLLYEYDARGDLSSRHDALQAPQTSTERFRHDALGRLRCAYFRLKEDPAAPCALSYDYAPDGNLKTKSDVGSLAYDDPLHPHAVTGAAGASFFYNAVGNQIARPGGATISYTPFDLPRTITQGATSAKFAYDGDEQRIRKATPAEETLYFEGLYERVLDLLAPGSPVAERFYVHSPERVVAIVTRGGADAGTRFVHVDHLGSIDALTDEGGGVVERRSYDPFGQRRNPIWGQPPPASFPSETTLGFTGHEADAEFGLVNMKGRIFDPKVGRFLTPDPIVSAPLSGQGWNGFSYVRNNPLNAIDPSGFEDWTAECVFIDSCGKPSTSEPPGPPATKEGENSDLNQAIITRASGAPNDVSTLGTGPTNVAPSSAVAAAGTSGPVPLTTHRLRAIAKAQGIGAGLTGIAFNRAVGLVFEHWVLTAKGFIPRNQKSFYSPDRARVNVGLPASVIPEYVDNASLFISPLFFPIQYPESSLYEVKAVGGEIRLSHSRSQILGLVDVAARSRAGVSTDPKRPLPLITFVTTGNTTIGADVLQEATQRGVAIWQQWVWEDPTTSPNDPLLSLGQAVPLNPQVYPGTVGVGIPLPIRSTLTSPSTPPITVPNDPDPPEVQ